MKSKKKIKKEIAVAFVSSKLALGAQVESTTAQRAVKRAVKHDPLFLELPLVDYVNARSKGIWIRKLAAHIKEKLAETGSKKTSGKEKITRSTKNKR